MKGVVFTEFLGYVEEVAGYAIVDEMIERADLPSGGAYTAVGKYDYQEMISLVSNLSQLLETPVPALLRAFGNHLFNRFYQSYPLFFDGKASAFEFLESVQNHIHVEVLKLYPDAELPQIDARRVEPDKLVITYSSCRPFGELCIGLIEGCGKHFGEEFAISHVPTNDGLRIEVCKSAAEAA